MVKRVFTSIITLAVLMGVLVACGGNGESQTQETSNNTSYVVPCADFNLCDLRQQWRLSLRQRAVRLLYIDDILAEEKLVPAAFKSDAHNLS